LRWHEITLRTTEEAADVIAHHFHEQGAGGVSIEESGALGKARDMSFGKWYEEPLNDIPEGQAEVKGYFPEQTDVDTVLRALQQALDDLPGYGFATEPGEWSVRIVDEEEWADGWKKYYKPVEITPRLVVKPVWEPWERREGQIVVELDPGMAFGTGTHATTALSLRLLESVVRPGDRVIDVGTGSGVLAIAAAKLGAAKVLALDLDPVAVTSAANNVRLNGLESAVEVRQSDLLSAVRPGTDAFGPVRIVVANILAEILLTFMDDVHAVLEPGGLYILSGIIAAKEDAVAQGLAKAGFDIERRLAESDWVALAARRRP
jgi:ribosomal protein L11 methyltransferase